MKPAFLVLLFASLAFAQPVPPGEDGPARPSPEADTIRKAGSDAADFMQRVAEQNRTLTDSLQREQAHGAVLQDTLDHLKALAWTPWTPSTVFESDHTYTLPDAGAGVAVNIVLNKDRVTLLGGRNLYTANQRAAVTFAANYCTLRGTAFNNPSGAASGRLGIGECVAAGNFARLTNPVTGNRVLDCTADRVDAFVKAYPDNQGLLVQNCQSTTDLRADGVFLGGASNVTVLDCDLTALYENTVRATQQEVTLSDETKKTFVSRNLWVLNSRVVNTGNKSAVNPRNVVGCRIVNCALLATTNNSAVGVGNGAGLASGDVGPSQVRVEDCQVFGGSLTVHQGKGVYLVGNKPRWVNKTDNSFISLNALPGNLADVKVIDNTPPQPYTVAQKGMVGYGDPTKGAKRENIDGYEEHGNGWATPATQPTTRPN